MYDSQNTLEAVPERSVAPATPSPQARKGLGLTMEAGRIVRLEGLLRKPEFNGTTGQLVEYDKGVERWKVAVHAMNGDWMMVRTANMRPVPDENDELLLEPGRRVRLEGLKSVPELNGTFGVVVEYNEVR